MNVELNTQQYSREIVDRFIEKVEKTENPSKCWPWKGASRGGLTVAQFQVRQGEIVSARKFAHWLWVGPIPEGRIIQVTCGNKMCVRPDHLCLSHGRPELILNTNDIQRFQRNVDCSGGPDACWPWIGARVATGSTNKTHVYGQFSFAGSQARAHRVAYAIAHNIPTPRNLQVRHVVCDNPICCNPKHLALGTARQNSQDKVEHGRQSRMCGESSPNSRLTVKQVEEMRRLRGKGKYQKHRRGAITLKNLAEQFNVSIATVGKVCSGELWPHVI